MTHTIEGLIVYCGFRLTNKCCMSCACSILLNEAFSYVSCCIHITIQNWHNVLEMVDTQSTQRYIRYQFDMWWLSKGCQFLHEPFTHEYTVPVLYIWCCNCLNSVECGYAALCTVCRESIFTLNHEQFPIEVIAVSLGVRKSVCVLYWIVIWNGTKTNEW